MREESDLLNEASLAPPTPGTGSPARTDANGATEPNAARRALATHLARVTAAPYAFDFFTLMRFVDALRPDLPRLGESFHPALEALRMAHEGSLTFAPAALSALEQGAKDPAPRLRQRFFGLIGPNAPLPVHLCELAIERQTHAGDPTLVRFLDMLMHRQLLFFYRAWAQGRPEVGLDRSDDRFCHYVGALIGINDPALRHRDGAGDHIKLCLAGMLQMQTRPADALVALLHGALRLPVALEPFAGHWLRLPRAERSRLGGAPAWQTTQRPTNQLGAGVVLGETVWDRQSRFRLRMGPLRLPQFETCLPGGRVLETITALVRFATNREFAWDLHLILRGEDVPRTVLGRGGRLGFTTWLGRWSRTTDAGDLVLDADAWSGNVPGPVPGHVQNPG